MLWVTITSVLCPVRKVTVCTGHYYYVRATACPVQIRAHHHTDVYTDINKYLYYCFNISNNSDLTELTPEVNLQMDIDHFLTAWFSGVI